MSAMEVQFVDKLAHGLPRESRWTCRACGKEAFELYMVPNEVWAEARLHPQAGAMHLWCLNDRLISIRGHGVTLEELGKMHVNGPLMWAVRRFSCTSNAASMLSALPPGFRVLNDGPGREVLLHDGWAEGFVFLSVAEAVAGARYYAGLP